MRKGSMPATNAKASGEVQIRSLIEARIKAIRAKDVEGATGSISEEIVLFDVVAPLRSIGSGALKKRATTWFSSFDGSIGFEIRDLAIAAANDIAFSYGLSHVSATTMDGRKLEMWWRSTICYRKIRDKWIVTHEHNSVPFDVGTGKASLELQP
jgi:ketosteroid isomerase-like protein